MMKPLIMLLSGLILTGCTYTVNFTKPLQESPPIYNAEPISVCLSDKLKNLTEKTSSWGESATLYVGKALQLVFKDDKSSNIHLELINNQLSLSSKEGLLLAKWDCTYLLSISLDNNGTKTVIYAQGIGSTMRGPTTSAQYAIENTVYDLYKQIKFHLSGSKKSE